jgi:hypothetical protein
MLQTTPPPEGIAQVSNPSARRSNRAKVFGCTPLWLHQMMPLSFRT